MKWCEPEVAAEYRGMDWYRPPVPPPVVRDPPKLGRTDADRAETLAKRNRNAAEPPSNGSASRGSGPSMAAAENILMSFALQTPEAHAHAKEVQEEDRAKSSRMSFWLSALVGYRKSGR